MPRRRRRPPPPLEDRDLAAEVLYLHSLWRRGPPAPAPVAVPAPTAKLSRSARHTANRRKRRLLERCGAAETEDARSEWPLAPSSPASADASPAEPTPPSPGSPAAEETISNGDSVRSGSSRRRQERCPAEAQGAGSPWPLAPSPSASSEARPSASPRAWPDTAASPAKPPPQPPSPGSLAQREALRAAAEFFSKDGSDDEGSESEGDEEEAAGFFTGMFERDAALREHYERGWEERQFACMACAGRKARRRRGRRFRGCVGLVQHAREACRNGRTGAHRALAAVVCRVLGWDIERLPSIVIHPRGTLGQALASRAQSDAHEAKMDVETEKKDSSTDVDGAVNELVTKESAEMESVGEIGPLNCKDSSKNNVVGHEAIQEEDAVKTRMEEPIISTDGEKEITELRGGKESSEKDNANKDDSLSQDNNGVVHEQDVAKEITEKENMNDICSKDTCDNEKHCIKASVQEELNATVSEPEHAKTADDIGDTVVTRLENSPTEKNVDENKEHANSIS